MSSTAIPSLGESIGTLYLGSNIASILYGIKNLQGLSYYRRYPNDWWVYRYSVTLLWVLDTLHVTLSTHALYFYLITMFGDLVGDLESDLWSMKWQLYLNVILSLYMSKGANHVLPMKQVILMVVVIGLYAVRLWKLGRHFHKILPWFIALAVIASLGSTIYVVHSIHITPNLASASNIKLQGKDLCFELAYVVPEENDSACSLFTLISYVVWPDSLIFLGINFVLSKIYINSLLAMLNSRSENHPTSRATEGGANSLPTVLRITPHSSEGDSAETNIGIPLRHVGSFSDKLDHSKEDLDCQV
ncbi:hypothetical protein ARMSODRAFT_1024294 [Armillaria solidipes]|uniref:DUF6534 domain-containing protein n=1 Tax=Armillaria solidipes TaxID=1076256 RepID=A0A2H3B263_9AGAR|nr:hypothetical protein ARMSODRAFT_1024294 [Armillaria solidipes]